MVRGGSSKRHFAWNGANRLSAAQDRTFRPPNWDPLSGRQDPEFPLVADPNASPSMPHEWRENRDGRVQWRSEGEQWTSPPSLLATPRRTQSVSRTKPPQRAAIASARESLEGSGDAHPGLSR